MKDRYFGCRGDLLTIWVTICCASAMTLYGYDQAVFSGVIITEDFLQVMDQPSANMTGTITSLYDLGCFFGAVSGTVFGSILGRKKSVIGGTVVMMIGAILQISAYLVPQTIVGRLVAGLGNGLNTATVPVWQSESAKPSWRGKLVVFGLVVNVAGFCIANWVDFGFSYLSGGISWRFPLALQLLFGIIILATAPWLPESPRWLISQDRIEEATQTLADVHGDNATPVHPAVLNAYRAERDNAVTWGDLLRNRTGDGGRGTLRRFCLGLGTQIIVQLSGVNATSYYLPTVLTASVGLPDKLARLLTAVNGIHYTFFSYLGMMLIDKWGRRGAMLFGTIGCACCYLALAILIWVGDSTTNSFRNHNYGAASVSMIFLYYAYFGTGWQGTAWLYNTEINSLHMRMKGASASVAAQWAINYMVVQVTPVGIQNLGWKFYLIWVFFNWASIPIIYCFYPETANRRLEDIDTVFKDGLRFWVFRDHEAVQVQRPERFIAMDLREEQTIVLDMKGGDAEHVVDATG
ncbi:general substrate transporter [Aspergillus ibericus CBS 121593]|uniref:General substrate transporter n=1 Tax=Aspergillus ibericus CBS 121593 TaxID=1448316 RepID=A0A395GRB6_9EURO|nr:general substrate transporter [Aspergillus ibericus CBS 121593]RAK97956.1 general substrate transporter [Aspergillus ibericus CBS 121593]